MSSLDHEGWPCMGGGRSKVSNTDAENRWDTLKLTQSPEFEEEQENDK